MERTTLGRSGLKVSVIGFGGWPAGGLHRNLDMDIGWDRVDPRDVSSAVGFALAAGVNLFDTCSAYGNSQELLAGCLRHVPRHSFVLSTKIGYVRGSYPNAFAPANIVEQLNRTLSLFHTDYVDILSFHNLYFGDRAEYFDGAMETFQRLKAEGKVRCIGARINHTPTFLAAEREAAVADEEQSLINRIAPDILHLKFNALMNVDSSWLDAARERVKQGDLGVIVNKPLAQGLLLSKRYPREGFPVGDHRRRKVEFTRESRRQLAQRLRPLYGGMDRAELVRLLLSYALSICDTAAVLVGTRTYAQARINFRFERRSLDEIRA